MSFGRMMFGVCLGWLGMMSTGRMMFGVRASRLGVVTFSLMMALVGFFSAGRMVGGDTGRVVRDRCRGWSSEDGYRS